MKIGDPLNDLAAAIHSACLRDLSEIRYEWRKPGTDKTTPRSRRPDTYSDITDVLMWTQMWGSTALGFGGVGGASMTTATVIVIECRNQECVVYFGGRFAYLLKSPNAHFREDCSHHRLVDVGYESRYEG